MFIAILNNNPDMERPIRKNAKKNVTSTSGYSIDAAKDIVASPESSRLLVRSERVTANLDKTKEVQEVLWQLVTAAHSLFIL